MPTTDHDLTASIDKLIDTQETLIRYQSYWRSLIHGIVAGIGGTLGVGIVLTLLSAFLNHASVIPVIGHWLTQLTPYVQSAVHR